MAGKRKHRLTALTKLFAGLLLSLFFKWKVEGHANLPQTSAFVLLPKHQRWVDIPLLALAVPRPLYYMAKVELFTNPISGWLLSSLGGVPVNRYRPLESRRFLKTMMAYLRGGEGIVVFPEGTYYRNRMGPGRVGLIRMIYSRLEIPFIPAGIHYEKGRGRTRVAIRFGKPLNGKDFPEAGRLLERVMSEMATLSGLKI